MTILEALRITTESIKTWVETNFLNKKNIDSALSTTSENPVQNKVVNTEIENIKKLVSEIDVSEQITEAINAIDYPVDSVNGKTGTVVLSAGDVGAATEDHTHDNMTADDFGIYVQAQEPAEAVAGDIWIDTANDPSYIPPTLPEITESDNGKVLMVVNGKLQLVNLNLSVDANGVVSM